MARPATIDDWLCVHNTVATFIHRNRRRYMTQRRDWGDEVKCRLGLRVGVSADLRPMEHGWVGQSRSADVH